MTRDTQRKWQTNTRSLRVTLAVCVFALCVEGGAAHREELPSLLVIHYDPPVSAAVRENKQVQVEVHTQLNLIDILTPYGMIIKANDPDYIPMWIRCPGRLTAVPEPSELLDILNGTVDVLPEDFLHNVSTVLTLRGKKLGHVKLTLYWELTNASMCVQLPDDIFPEEAASIESLLTPHDNATKPTAIRHKSALETESLIRDSVSSTVASAKEETDTKKKDFLNKKFVIVRQQPTKRKTPQTSEDDSDHGALSMNIFGRRRRSVDSFSDEQIDRGSKLQDPSKKIVIAEGYDVHVLREEDNLDTTLFCIASVLVAVNVLFIGFRAELPKVEKPKKIALAIVAVWHFAILPIVSYVLASLYFDGNPSSQFALFALSCSPAAIFSNSWTFAKDGDANLSVLITFASVVCSFITMPVWFHTLGRTLLLDAPVSVPYLWLVVSLLTLTIPLAIGVALGHFFPNVEKRRTKTDVIISWTVVIIISCLGIGRCLHSFSEINWKLAIAGFIVACFGYSFGCAFGFAAARFFSFDAKSVVAISITSAFQNPAISFMALQLTLPKPDSDLSSVSPVVQMLFTSLPLILFHFYGVIRNEFHEKNDGKNGKPRKNIEIVTKGGAGACADKPKAQPLLAVLRSDLNFRESSSETSLTYVGNEPLTSELINEATLNSAQDAQTNENKRNTFNTFGK